jgi:hypothetical protein
MVPGARGADWFTRSREGGKEVGHNFKPRSFQKNGENLRKLTLNRHARTRECAQYAVAKADFGWGDICIHKAMQRTYHKQNPVGKMVAAFKPLSPTIISVACKSLIK